MGLGLLISFAVLTAGCGPRCTDWGLYVIQADGRGKHRVRPDGNPQVTEAVWFAGGRRIWLDIGICQPLIVRSDGSDPRPAPELRPGTSAADTRLVPVKGRYDSWRGFAIVRRGRAQRRILFHHALLVEPCGDNVAFPQLSPDGKFVVYPDKRGRQIDLFVVATTGHSQPTRLTSDTAIEQTPVVWSPTSKAIAFSTYDPIGRSYGGVYILNIAQNTRRLISRDGQYVAWSPDGQQLALVNHDLYVTDLRGRVIRRVATSDHTGIYGLTWSPAHSIAYVEETGDKSKCGD